MSTTHSLGAARAYALAIVAIAIAPTRRAIHQPPALPLRRPPTSRRCAAPLIPVQPLRHLPAPRAAQLAYPPPAYLHPSASAFIAACPPALRAAQCINIPPCLLEPHSASASGLPSTTLLSRTGRLPESASAPTYAHRRQPARPWASTSTPWCPPARPSDLGASLASTCGSFPPPSCAVQSSPAHLPRHRRRLPRWHPL